MQVGYNYETTNTHVALACNPATAYRLTLPHAEDIWIYTNKADSTGKTLKAYIEEQSGVTVGTVNNTTIYNFSGTADRAKGLAITSSGDAY